MNRVYIICLVLVTLAVLNCVEAKKWKFTQKKWNACQKICRVSNTKYVNSVQNCYKYNDLHLTVTKCVARCLSFRKGKNLSLNYLLIVKLLIEVPIHK